MPSNQLKNLAKFVESRKREIPYTVLLGSGLSMTHGVLKKLGYENWDTFHKEMQHRSSEEWHSLLKEPFDSLRLQEGYRCLVQLLKEGYFNILLTANFDPYLEDAMDAIQLPSRERDDLVNGEHDVEHIIRTLKRPQPRIKICMFRGRLRKVSIPKVSENLQFNEELKTTLKDYLERDMIVLGASDRDTDIIRYIPPKREGSLWLISTESTIPDQWKRLQQSSGGGEIITGADGDFNRFFSALVEQLGLQENRRTNGHTNDFLVLPKRPSDLLNTDKNYARTLPIKEPEHLDVSGNTVVYATPTNGTGKHWGIVVGITEHEDEAIQDQLEGCGRDAEMLYQQLICCSFHPARTYLLSGDLPALPNKDDILSRLRTSAQATGPDDLLLFYYSGVVDEDENDAYFIVPYSLPSKLQKTAIPMQGVKDRLISSPASAKVMLLDICYAATSGTTESNKRRTEKFIQRIFTQTEGLTILAAHKKGHEQLKCSVFTHLLVERIKRLVTSSNKGVISVPALCHDLMESESITPYLSPSSESQNAIFCRYYQYDPDSYLISTYLYVVKAQIALKHAQEVVSKAEMITQDTCQRLHAILDQIDDPASPRGTHYSQTTLTLWDTQEKFLRRVQGLISDIVTLRHKPGLQRRGIQALPQPIAEDLTKTLAEVEELVNKLRHEFISEDIDR
jgi:Caspase domain